MITLGDSSQLETELITSNTLESNPYSAGLRILELSEDQVEELGNFLFDFFQKRRDKYKDKQVTRTPLTMIKGAIFAIGTKNLNNPEWKEHCATSLREIFHEWKESEMKNDFVDFYRKDVPLESKEIQIFIEFKIHYDYLTGIDHHEASRILGSLTTLLKDNSLKLENCFKDDIFLDRIKKFFLILSQINEYSK